MNHGKGNHPWPEGNVQMLRSLWAEGFSASQIAVKMNKLLGLDLTRNAVIAKVHRLQLARRAPSTGARKSRKGLPRPAPKPKPTPTWKPDNHRAKGARPSEHNIPHAKASWGIHCEMFLEGEEGAQGLVCGRPVEIGQSWCVDCRKLAYEPQKPGRRAA